MKARVVIVGAPGYSGAELASILLGHPGVDVVGLFGSAKREEAAETFDRVFPRFRNRLTLSVMAASVPEIVKLSPTAVFLCTPHEASVELAAQLVEREVPVFDLSAAFRLPHPAAYPTHYGFTHPRSDLLSTAVYGLPEINRERIRGANLVAVPGCYPTSAIIPLRPLVAAEAIGRRPNGRIIRPIIDSTSGVSGAGRSLSLRSMFCEVHQQPYGVFKHRHQPEIDEYVGVDTVFTPHLGPYERGILSTIHVTLAPEWNGAKVTQTLAAAYAHEPFVRLCPSGVWPGVGDVRATNFCDIGWAVDERDGHLIIASAIDNLTKGAAGQAVQCMNLRLGFDEGAGLLPAGAGR